MEEKGINTTSLYGLVLAGGQSTRMKKDKSLLNYHGQTQVEHCFHLLSDYCESVFISNRKEQSGLIGHQKLPQIHDTYVNVGPLGGILSAMSAYPSVAWLVLACDLPHVHSQTIRFLIKERNHQKMATAYRSSQNRLLPEPLCAIYETKSRRHILKYYENNVYCPRKILLNSDVHMLDPDEKHALDNVNDPEQYEAAAKDLKLTRVNLSESKKIHLTYYAFFRDKARQDGEHITTSASTPRELYAELERRYQFNVPIDSIKVSINDEFTFWETLLHNEDHVVFIPPVSGGSSSKSH